MFLVNNTRPLCLFWQHLGLNPASHHSEDRIPTLVPDSCFRNKINILAKLFGHKTSKHHVTGLGLNGLPKEVVHVLMVSHTMIVPIFMKGPNGPLGIWTSTTASRLVPTSR